jgi:hypothetical protein
MFLNSLAHLYTGISCVIQAKPKEAFVKNLRSSTFFFIYFSRLKEHRIFGRQVNEGFPSP